MLAGIYYGAQYGGSTTSILVNMPGEASSIVTCIDGHQMARQGRAGAALAVAALGSFFAGCVGTVFIAAFAPAARGARAAVQLAGLFLADGARPGDRGRAGARLGHQGDRHGAARPAARPRRHRRQQPAPRATRSASRRFWDGIDFLPLVIGLFGIVEIIRNLEQADCQRTPMSATDSATCGRAGRLQGCLAAGAARHRPRLAARHPAGRRRGARVVRELHGGEEDRQATRAASARARSKASRDRNPPTTPRRRPRSFRCSRSACRPTPSWR